MPAGASAGKARVATTPTLRRRAPAASSVSLRKLHWTETVALLALPACLPAVAPWLCGLHWTLDLAACFPVQAIAWLAVAALALAIGRKWWLAGTAAAFGATGFCAVAPAWFAPNNIPGDVENDPRIRVLALNLLRENTQGHEALWKIIQQTEPDVIFCGEYTPHWQDFLTTRLSAWPHRCEQPHAGHFGVAMFSRLPMTAEILPLHHTWAPCVRATVTTPFGAIGALGVHPPPPSFSGRRVAERDHALAAIAPRLAALPPDRVVLGDFNATPWNAAFAAMRDAAGLTGGTTDAWRPTWPAQLPLPFRIPIDHVLVTARLAIAEVVVGDSFGSDHLPVMAVVRVAR